ncbi:HyaD/HybD family hydrogenase maturation endopeptidase [Ferribacterium limneticum]|uniref:HyaD/HybD family hydrogenase maturation endopeptidase n=1 Tax=Ferribacterium limneticum TaxID=76259 RepID=UPI001CF87ADA|nr:HyaD/HybD family hydrogenase maturation endopeptidase [Ferribacterium limneticum]UCV22732.1 HyaD/HybD family hydrogenase maturation endopeptidase [Ferribacterium limneticum]
MRIVVLGIGNILLTDEGVGVRTIEALERDYVLPADVEVIDGGTCGMEMLEQLENLDGLIVVDCVRCNQPPATPVLLKGDDVPVFFRTKLSPHQVSLSDVLASLEFTDRAPKSIAIVGMQPVSMALGLELSPEVAVKVPDLLAMTLAELQLLGVDAKRRA